MSRCAGALLGLAAGDALGTTVEFSPPGSFIPLTDIVGGGPFHLKPGEWTDDTSMALCLADSLIHCGAFNPWDQMDRYVRWWTTGYLGSNGRCFDIGNTTRDALERYRRTGDPMAGSANPRAAGNGCLMRLAPVPLFFAADPATAIRLSGLSARTTHGAAVCVDACRYLGALLVGAAAGESREALLSELYTPVPGFWDEYPLHPEVEAVARGSFKRKEPPAIKGSGYVAASLEAALWAFHQARDFRAGCLAAVNLGDDADTTGAVYGQLAGAHFGLDGIPQEWRPRLARPDLLHTLARLLAAQRPPQSGAALQGGEPSKELT
ncbi:MAG: ADP-ribosylglycohydrolase family protein [Acidobacteria bacterium]|nr:ADP-ribosylglycohydrolase family protein [Acidobacteriota bacterium]